jgi:KaiC/GvpD/RAD55 family RecA-like ATPase
MVEMVVSGATLPVVSNAKPNDQEPHEISSSGLRSRVPSAGRSCMITAFKPLTLQELIELEIPEPNWLVDGLIQEGKLVLLAAREKSGKGLLTIDLVASVAEGSEFLGRATTQGKAIYCATEETLGEVQTRVLNRMGETKEPVPVMILPLDGTTGDTLDVTKPDSVDRLRAMIEEHQPKLLVIDVLREIHDRKEDSSDDMAPILRVLRSLAHQTGTAIVLNHHMSKSGHSRGSTAIGGGADVLMELQSNPDDGASTALGGILTVKGRSVPKQRLSISFGVDSRWTATGDPPPGTPRPSSKKKLLAALISSPEPLSVKQIAEKTGISQSTVNNELRGMKSRDSPLVTTIPAGRRGGGFLYSLLPAGESAARGD